MPDYWTVEAAAERAFRTAEEGEKYIDRLLSCCKDAATAVRRILLLLILCMAVFELLNRAAVEKITLTFVEIKDQASVLTFLPAVVACLQYQLVRQMLHWRSLERTYTAVARVVEPRVAENGLGGFVVPNIPLFSTRHPPGALFARVFSFQHRIEGLFTALGAFSLPFFQTYAFVQLYNRANARVSPALATSLGVTAALTAAYLVSIGVVAAGVVHWRFYHLFVSADSAVQRKIAMIRQRSRPARGPCAQAASAGAKPNVRTRLGSLHAVMRAVRRRSE